MACWYVYLGHSAQQVTSFAPMIMECTHDEYSDMFLNLDTCGGTAAQKCALPYSCRCCSDAKCSEHWGGVPVRQEMQCLRHTWMQVAHRLYGYKLIAVLEREPWGSSRNITRDCSIPWRAVASIPLQWSAYLFPDDSNAYISTSRIWVCVHSPQQSSLGAR